MIKELEYPSYSGSIGRVSWGAIFSGAIVSLSVLFCLMTLGVGIGLVSAPAADTAEGLAKGLGAGAAVWTLFAGVISYYAGGWVAGRLCGIGRVSDSVVHGVVSWGVGTLAVAFLFTTAALGALGAAANVVGGTAQIAAEGAGAAAGQGGLDLGRLAEQGRQAIGQAQGTTTPAEVRETAAQASGAAGAAGLFGFFMLLFNGLAAGYGARAGTRLMRPVNSSEYRRHEKMSA